MASREELSLYRAARAGKAQAQVVLGRRYLLGGEGLPKSMETGLYWLGRAARQGEPDAWILIGTHVPFEDAVRAQDRSEIHVWYERAFDEGVLRAGLVLAKLVLGAVGTSHSAALRSKAWKALERAAEAGIGEAQWLLAQELGKREAAADGHTDCGTDTRSDEHRRPMHLEWARRAAESGEHDARRYLADRAWRTSDYAAFLHWALPVADIVAKREPEAGAGRGEPGDGDVLLLSRCAQALFRNGHFAGRTIERFAELAAKAGNKEAQLCLGLWFAKMDATGKHVVGIQRLINYRKAILWLTAAGLQGCSDAWYAVSRIYLKAEFAYRSVDTSEKYLRYAAHAGHRNAQLELGKRLWRKRQRVVTNDVDAAYWLQRAAAQGCEEARTALGKVTARAHPAAWAVVARHRILNEADSFLKARIDLAAHFGLKECEALLIDVNAADLGHCLLVDIRQFYGRTSRRLVLVETAEDRHVLNRVKATFEKVDCGPAGPEGTYRQRRCRLRKLLGLNLTPASHKVGLPWAGSSLGAMQDASACI